MVLSLPWQNMRLYPSTHQLNVLFGIETSGEGNTWPEIEGIGGKVRKHTVELENRLRQKVDAPAHLLISSKAKYVLAAYMGSQ